MFSTNWVSCHFGAPPPTSDGAVASLVNFASESPRPLPYVPAGAGLAGLACALLPPSSPAARSALERRHSSHELEAHDKLTMTSPITR